MNNDPLAGLKDIHLPSDIGWWPPALGWWLLLGLIVLSLVFVGYKLSGYLKKGRYRKEALAKLRDILCQYQESQRSECFLQDVSVVLRRVAVQVYGRYEVAGLSDEEWLKFLDRTGETEDFVKGPGSVLGRDIYKPKTEADAEKVFAVVEKWIRKHK